MRSLGGGSKLVLNYCKARISTASSTITAGTDQSVGFDVEDADTSSFHNTVTNNSRFIAPADGTYRFTARVRVGVTAATQVEAWFLRTPATGSDTAKHGYLQQQMPNVGYEVVLVALDILDLLAGDYVELHVRPTTNSIALKGGSVEGTTIIVDQLSSGAGGSGSMTSMGAAIRRTASQTIPSGVGTFLTSWSAEDRHSGGVSTDLTTGEITVPEAGSYIAATHVRFNDAAVYLSGLIYFAVNGTAGLVGVGLPQPTSSASFEPAATKVLVLGAGDVVRVKVVTYMNSGDGVVTNADFSLDRFSK